MSEPQSDIIRLKDVMKLYEGPGGDVLALQNLKLTVRRGEFLAVMGPSGSGKTTLMGVCAGILDVNNGEVSVDGHDFHLMAAASRLFHARRTMAIIRQNYSSQLFPGITVGNHISLALKYAVRANDLDTEHILQSFNLFQHRDSLPGSLSGGQQQLLNLAMALSRDVPLLIADEPTGNLDPDTADMVLDHIQQIQRERTMTVFLVTHDSRVARRADRQIYLEDGYLSRERRLNPGQLQSTLREHPGDNDSMDHVIDNQGRITIPRDFIDKHLPSRRVRISPDTNGIRLTRAANDSD